MNNIIIFKIEKNDDGYWAHSDDLPSVTSYSDVFCKIKTNIQEALELYYEDRDEQIPKFDIQILN